jgi:hypothetical protein
MISNITEKTFGTPRLLHEIRYLHGGLVQQYTIPISNNVCETYFTCQQNHMYGKPAALVKLEKRVESRLPLMITLPFWRRHNFCIHDIRNILHVFPCVYLWQLVAMFGINISFSIIHFSFSTPSSTRFGSKSTAIKKIIRFISTYYPEFNHNRVKLTDNHPYHTPACPIHGVNKQIFTQLISRVRNIRQQGRDMYYNGEPFEFLDILWCPLWYELNDVYAVRVITETDYLACGFAKQSLSNNISIHLNNIRYVGLDEAVFFAYREF